MFSNLLYESPSLGIPNTLNSRYELETRKIWTTTTTWGPLPSILLRARTHDAVVLKVPYAVAFGDATYPGGLTAAPATSTLALIWIAQEVHAAAGYFWGFVAGYVPDAVTTAAVPAGSSVEVINAGVSVIDEAVDFPLRGSSSIGFAMDAAASSVVDVWMYGESIEIASS